jgi:hypothetical protein
LIFVNFTTILSSQMDATSLPTLASDVKRLSIPKLHFLVDEDASRGEIVEMILHSIQLQPYRYSAKLE